MVYGVSGLFFLVLFNGGVEGGQSGNDRLADYVIGVITGVRSPHRTAYLYSGAGLLSSLQGMTPKESSILPST